MTEELNPVRQNILNDSLRVDEQFISLDAAECRTYSLDMPVPSHHKRSNAIHSTIFEVAPFSKSRLDDSSYYLVDDSLRETPISIQLGAAAAFVKAEEGTLKEISWLESFTNGSVPANVSTVVGVGGGILLNAAAFIAERRGVDFVSVPTTVLAAADSAIGGLVRINKVTGNDVQKSFVKSVYEPSRIIIDPNAFASLPHNQISFGLSEVIKHGVYQSRALLDYLASNDFRPFTDNDSLLKAVCWTAALKNVAIIHDPDSLSFGSDVLRGGHKLALAIEEKSHFRVSHGEAVAVGVYQDVQEDESTIELLDAIYGKLGLPKSEADLPS